MDAPGEVALSLRDGSEVLVEWAPAALGQLAECGLLVQIRSAVVGL